MYNIKPVNIYEYYVGGHLNGLLICIFTVAVVFFFYITFHAWYKKAGSGSVFRIKARFESVIHRIDGPETMQLILLCLKKFLSPSIF